MTCQILSTIVGAMIGIVGTLAIFLLNNFLQEKRERRNAFFEFQKTFTGMMSYLHQRTKLELPFGRIPNMIDSHVMAKGIFLQYLRKRSVRKSFNEAWDEYYNECKKYCKPFNLKFEELPQYLEALLEKLNKLLDVAGRG